MTIVVHLFKDYIKGTPKRALVQMVEIHLCHLTAAVIKGVGLSPNKVYLNTRVLKHMYDKRPAEEFDLMLFALIDVVKYPNKVYKNKNGKRGSYCFVKEVKNSKCLVSIETICEKTSNEERCQIVTFFRTDDSYLSNFELLWEWKGGNPSS